MTEVPSKSLRVPEYNNDRVASKEHLAYEPIFVDRESFLLALSSFRNLQLMKKLPDQMK